MSAVSSIPFARVIVSPVDFSSMGADGTPDGKIPEEEMKRAIILCSVLLTGCVNDYGEYECQSVGGMGDFFWAPACFTVNGIDAAIKGKAWATSENLETVTPSAKEEGDKR